MTKCRGFCSSGSNSLECAGTVKQSKSALLIAQYPLSDQGWWSLILRSGRVYEVQSSTQAYSSSKLQSTVNVVDYSESV